MSKALTSTVARHPIVEAFHSHLDRSDAPLNARYHFDPSIAEAADDDQKAILTRRGIHYLEACSLQLCELELPRDFYSSHWPSAPKLAKEIARALSLEETGSLSAFPHRLEPLGDVFDRIRAAATARERSSPVSNGMVNGDDVVKLKQLLVRLRACTDTQIGRPARMADLHPPMPLGPTKAIALSKLACDVRHSKILLMAHDSKAGDATSFLAKVLRTEVLSEGALPCLLPKAVLKAFLFDLVRETLVSGGGVWDAQNCDNLVTALTSDNALAQTLFRMGIYQDVPGCAFDGLDARYPAVAFHLLFAVICCSAPEGRKAPAVLAVIQKIFRVQLRLLVEAYGLFKKIMGKDEEPAPKRQRRVLLPVQPPPLESSSQNNMPETSGREAVQRKESRPRHPSPPSSAEPEPSTARALEMVTRRSLREGVPGRTSVPTIRTVTTKRQRRELPAIMMIKLGSTVVLPLPRRNPPPTLSSAKSASSTRYESPQHTCSNITPTPPAEEAKPLL
ncbi:hypothetical protein C8R44DRAFT_896336 [Mycena epipterygia]|nr:hypothetical protein C8R44DRAFT_896336 [Mycena epipterygia]